MVINKKIYLILIPNNQANFMGINKYKPNNLKTKTPILKSQLIHNFLVKKSQVLINIHCGQKILLNMENKARGTYSPNQKIKILKFQGQELRIKIVMILLSDNSCNIMEFRQKFLTNQLI